MAKKIQCSLPFDQNVEDFLKKNHPEVVDFRILSQSLDARRANQGRVPKYQYSLEVIAAGEQFERHEEQFPKLGAFKQKPIIIGAGPAGLFCALRLAEYGVPSIIIERGARAHERMLHIARFWRYGEFDRDNNVCYGEGGAGLFSDGKLITRVRSPYVKYVMQKFVDFGAPPETAYLSNPHLGSNKIRGLINKMTDDLKARGCEFHYHAQVTKLLLDQKRVQGVELADGRQLFSDHVVLATGHSSHEIYEQLKEHGIAMAPKDFAVGVRIEHPRKVLDHMQYGPFTNHPALGAARYRLSYHDESSHKGTYSFCMCPGGYVLSSGTDADGIVVNGMSNYARNSPWSNAALVVTVKAQEDYPVSDILGGLFFQRKIEQQAYQASKEFAQGKEVPTQRIKDFYEGRSARVDEQFKSSCPSGNFGHELERLFPAFIVKHLRTALAQFDQHLPGFLTNDGILMAPETRTSAPVTITRDEVSTESESHAGLYPCGEGAGYAGGITSAAADGCRVAMALLAQVKNYLV